MACKGERDARHAEDVDEEVVPGALLDVALAERRRREVRRPVRKRVDEDLRVRQVAGVLERRLGARVLDVARDVLRRVVRLVRRRVAVGEDRAHRFEQVPARLLRDHVRVALPARTRGRESQHESLERRKSRGSRDRDAPGDLREVVGVERREAARQRVAVPAARPAALLDRVRRHDGRQRLEARRRRVHVGEERKVALLERRLARVVRRHHGAARVVERERLDERREDARLDEEVVEDLALGRLAAVVGLRRVPVGKLAAHGAVPDRDGRRAREDHAGLLHDVGADEGLRARE